MDEVYNLLIAARDVFAERGGAIFDKAIAGYGEGRSRVG